MYYVDEKVRYKIKRLIENRYLLWFARLNKIRFVTLLQRWNQSDRYRIAQDRTVTGTGSISALLHIVMYKVIIF